jgi:hypothetical protein
LPNDGLAMMNLFVPSSEDLVAEVPQFAVARLMLVCRVKPVAEDGQSVGDGQERGAGSLDGSDEAPETTLGEDQTSLASWDQRLPRKMISFRGNHGADFRVLPSDTSPATAIVLGQSI